MSQQQAPFGSFSTPITSELIASKTIRLSAVHVGEGGVYWNETRPVEDGRGVIVFHDGEKSADLFPAPWNARSTVHEYGGGECCVDGGDVYFCNFSNQAIHRVKSTTEEPKRLTPESSYRYTDFVLTKTRSRKIICVREDHSGEGEAVNTLVAVSLADPSDVQVLVDGEDFYASPCLSPCGNKLAWLTWNHPAMPWDGTELWVADIVESELDILSLENIQLVAGSQTESIFLPQWSPKGELVYVSDRSGWWNLYRWRVGGEEEGGSDPLCPMDAEFGVPQWQFRYSTYGFLADGRIVCAFNKDGSHLAILDPEHGMQEVPTPFTSISYVSCHGQHVAFLGSSPTEFAAVVLWDTTKGTFTKLRTISDLVVDPDYISVPQSVEFPTEGGLTAHGLYYPPKNKLFTGLEGELPPLVVKIHGGPTTATNSSLNLSVQYWTSRGFAVFDVNYGGSTGYGREYRNRLRLGWGLVDVQDCDNGARHLVARGLADPLRLVITGGSAGGYTTLAALTFTDTFRAGASHYGICDLEVLARDTHKFESRYTDGLIGKYPEERVVYAERSPIHFTDRLSAPVAFFQGLEDKVVLLNQAEMMVAALRAKGLPVAYVPFEGEQHGFRKAENIKKALDGELYFYSRVFGFAPAEGESIAIDIENCPPRT